MPDRITDRLAEGTSRRGFLSRVSGAVMGLAGAGTAPLERTVRARPGDSLWSIAEVFHGDVSITRYVDALIARNGGTRIDAGQVVRLP